MKTLKGELIGVLLLLISATLIISGCPGTAPTEEPTPPVKPTEYAIMNRNPPNSSAGQVRFNPISATQGTKIEIELMPSPSYEPYDLNVYNRTNYIHVDDLSPTFISDVYKYSFTMPASNVEIDVSFIPRPDAIDNYTTGILASSAWDKIDALNILIGKEQNQILDPKVIASISKLVGPVQYPVSPAPPVVTVPLPPPRAPGAAGAVGAPIPWTWDHLGLIRAKMRNEDLTTWLPLKKWPSEKMVKGANITGDLDSDTNSVAAVAGGPTNLGADRTILYFVREDNVEIPALNIPGKKLWEAGALANIDNAVDNPPLAPNRSQRVYPLVQNMDGVREIPLKYKVGINNANYVEYRIWLWPVAQYTLQNDSGVDVTVYLQDYEYTRPGGGRPDTWILRGDPQILNANNQQAIGYVGNIGVPGTGPAVPAGAISIPPPPPLAFPPVPTYYPTRPIPVPANGDRNVIVGITTTTQNVLIHVIDSTGSRVRDLNNNPINFIRNTHPGFFYPDSRNYTILVSSSAPPIGQ